MRESGSSPGRKEAQSRVVVRLPNWVGDVVASLPSLGLLLRVFDDVICVGPGFAPQLLPPQIRTYFPVAGKWRELRALGEIPRTRFLILRSAFHSAFVGRCLGFSTAGHRKNLRSPWLAFGMDLPPATRKAELLFSLTRGALEHWGLDAAATKADAVPRLPLTEEERREARERLAAVGLETGGFLVCCPLSAGKRKRPDWKRWQGFPGISERLAREGIPHLACPAPGQEEESKARLPAALPMEGLNLRQLAAVMGESACVVSNDSGPMHLAAAVGARTVGIFGDTDPETYGAAGDRVTHLGCLGRWPRPEKVWEVVADILREPAAEALDCLPRGAQLPPLEAPVAARI